MPVPCGRCEQCLKRRVSAWSFRLMQEDRRSESSVFLTLTYDNKFVPITRNRFLSLEPRDIQLFLKRLRKAHDSTDRPIRYYAVGEYGGRTRRPHYHFIMFNAKLKLIGPAWGLGDIHYGEVSGASVGYTLKYLAKPTWYPMHRNDDRYPQFSRMSKGLGKGYLTPAIIQYHKANLEDRMCLTLPDGRKAAMPRYYKDKIYNSEERGYLKGYFEKMLIEDDLEKFQLNKGKHALYYTEAVKASFERIKYKLNNSTETL